MTPYCPSGRPHHWLIASPNGGELLLTGGTMLPAVCKFCRAMRTFPNIVWLRADEGDALLTGAEMTAISAARRQWRREEYGDP